jgi:hypothetical protein
VCVLVVVLQGKWRGLLFVGLALEEEVWQDDWRRAEEGCCCRGFEGGSCEEGARGAFAFRGHGCDIKWCRQVESVMRCLNGCSRRCDTRAALSCQSDRVRESGRVPRKEHARTRDCRRLRQRYHMSIAELLFSSP